jgi:uncharacterized protein (DUF2237 family)
MIVLVKMSDGSTQKREAADLSISAPDGTLRIEDAGETVCIIAPGTWTEAYRE